ncbi:MAG: NAD(+)/NADH kinase [Bdellovibrionaceae bacterium]|nr:NAD(+)/NADH kinase [Bdellovibrio sp.]
MRKVHLIANANSGNGVGATLSEMALKVCTELGFELVHHNIDDPKTLDALAEKTAQLALSDNGMIIAAGGDGTIRSVAEKVQGHPIRFGVIACGTFNFFARTHKLPDDNEQAFRLALLGEVQKVRLGEVNGRIFLINASLGLYAKSIRDREMRTKRWGRNRVVAIISTFMSLLQGHRLLNVTLTFEKIHKKVQTQMIFIGNNALQLRDLSMDVADCMKRDLLAVVLMKPLKTWGKLRVIFHGISSTIDNDKGLISFCVDDLLIETRRPMHIVALDGEMFQMKTPLVVRALPGVLNLVKVAPPE